MQTQAKANDMGKAKRERELADNEAQAVARNLRVSPQKLNLVGAADPRQEGRHGAGRSRVLAQAHRQDVRKCVMSAVANAENNHDLDVNELVVAEAYVGKNSDRCSASMRAAAAA